MRTALRCKTISPGGGGIQESESIRSAGRIRFICLQVQGHFDCDAAAEVLIGLLQNDPALVENWDENVVIW